MPGLKRQAPKYIAWTGGDYAYDHRDVSLARAIYRWHLTIYWEHWCSRPTRSQRDIYKRWSRSDAYATRRENT